MVFIKFGLYLGSRLICRWNEKQNGLNPLIMLNIYIIIKKIGTSFVLMQYLDIKDCFIYNKKNN